MNIKAPSPTFKAIFEAVCRIPPGRVATYAQVARMAGLSRGARTVGWALRALPESSEIPWHRVVGAQGSLRWIASDSLAHALQRHLLEEEGILFQEDGRIDLSVYQF